VFSISGCESLKNLAIKQPRDEVIQKSYPNNAFAYKLGLVVHASPEEFIDYFGGDFSTWMKKHAQALHVDTSKMDPRVDLSKVGNSVDLSVKLLGISLPFRMTCIKHVPKEELWLMMVLTDDSWIMIRLKTRPSPEGCIVESDVLGQYSRYLGTILDGFQVVEAFAHRADMIITLVQSDFDPELDVEKITSSLRGDLYETFLQGNESSVWIDASPREVTEWILADPENLDNLIPNLSLQGKCYENPGVLFSDPEDSIYCPSTYMVGDKEVMAQVLSKGGWKNGDKQESNSNLFWITFLDTVIKARIDIEKQGSGSIMKMVLSSELPASQTPEAMDLRIGIAAVPGQMEEILLHIKAGVEGLETSETSD
jgi:hypothetical protein